MTVSMEQIGGHGGAKEKPTRSPAARRRRLFLTAAAISVVLATCGVAASTMVKSPAQLAAEAKAPPATSITAQVEKRVLSDTVVARGNVAATTRFEVTPQGGGQGAATQVVTAVHTKTGDPVKEGGAMLEVSGRPLIALGGAVPIYRDLKPGEHGPDIAELQHALGSLGYGKGADTDGEFGPGTKIAVEQLYAHLGYDVPTTSPDDAARLKTAQQAVDTAQRQVDELESQQRAAGQPPAAAGPASGKSGTGGSAASGGESLAVQLKYAQKALASAQEDYRTLGRTTGPMVPVSEVVFLPAFPAQVTAFSAKVGDPVKAPLITLSTGKLQVYSRMTPDRAALLKPGMPVEIAVTGSDQRVTGKVDSVGEPSTAGTPSGGGQPGGTGGTGGNSSGGDGALMSQVVVVPDSDLGPQWAGKDVQLTVVSASSGSEVLVVPLSAVSTGADGRTSVVKVSEEPGPPSVPVEVVAGLSGDGFVQVTPVQAGRLSEHDRVMVSAK